MEHIEVKNGDSWKLKKIHIYLLIGSALLGIVSSASQPIVWKTKIDLLQEKLEIRQVESEQKIIKQDEEIEYMRNLTKEIKFNLKRLMEDKFKMPYIEDADKK